MVARTPNRGYTYPECDPPLVKDRSDIVYLRDLAEQVNTDAGAMDARIVDFLEKPDSARISFSGNLVSTGAAAGQASIFPYNVTTFDNTPGSTALTTNSLFARERGWYLVVSNVRCTNGAVGTEQSFLVRHLRNGVGNAEGRRFEGLSHLVTAAGDGSMESSDVLLLQAGDHVTTQVLNYGTAGTFNWEGHLTMVQVLKLDV